MNVDPKDANVLLNQKYDKAEEGREVPQLKKTSVFQLPLTNTEESKYWKMIAEERLEVMRQLRDQMNSWWEAYRDEKLRGDRLEERLFCTGIAGINNTAPEKLQAEDVQTNEIRVDNGDFEVHSFPLEEEAMYFIKSNESNIYKNKAGINCFIVEGSSGNKEYLVYLIKSKKEIREVKHTVNPKTQIDTRRARWPEIKRTQESLHRDFGEVGAAKESETKLKEYGS